MSVTAREAGMTSVALSEISNMGKAKLQAMGRKKEKQLDGRVLLKSIMPLQSPSIVTSTCFLQALKNWKHVSHALDMKAQTFPGNNLNPDSQDQSKTQKRASCIFNK